ncbi:sulfotransferase ssu-1 [Rhipicephalus microplus]|uniref:sulfotransferase ssu-1 n=1 Tax=Rhipicephalus microplus TaxID=6941 RepID=UPI003F6D4FEF
METPNQVTPKEARASSGVADGRNQRLSVYHVIEGLHLSRMFTERSIKSAMSYRPRDDDVFVVSYPKCGNTWLRKIVSAVLNCGQSPGKSGATEELSTYLDFVGADGVRSTPRPACLKTHLPFGKLPYSPKAKYIYITRNPHDCCVSFYYHTRRLPTYRFQDGTFDQFFNMFVEGKVDYGDYFDNLLSWYTHRDCSNLLFITYEQLKKDTAGWVQKIANFLGEEQYGERIQKHPELLERVLASVSVLSMKSLNSAQRCWTGLFESVPAQVRQELTNELKVTFGDIWDVPDNGGFVRKGLVGDWKSHFNAEQIKIMQDRIALKTCGTDVMELWKDVGLP